MEENEKTIVFYNSSKGWRELLEAEKPLLASPILFRVKKNAAMCQNHCRWEEAKLISDTEIELSCGRKQSGLIIFYRDEGEKFEELLGKGAYLKKFSLREESNFYRDDKDFCDLVEQVNDGLENLDDDLENAENDENHAANSDVFAIEVKYNIEKCTAKIVYHLLNRERAEKLNIGNLSWRHIPTKTEVNLYSLRGFSKKNSNECYYSSIEYQNLELPHIIEEQIEEIAKKLLASFAKREVRTAKNLYHGQYFLQAIAECPYEITFYELSDTYRSSIYMRKYFKHDDSDCYNLFCEGLGFKSFPTLRKLFEIHPVCLLDYKELYEIGFRDKNIMIHFLQKFYLDSPKAVEKLYLGESMPFFFTVSKVYRSEKEILNAIFRDKKLTEYTRRDTAKMFQEYYTLLSVEERNKIIREGLTRENHDLLVKFANRIKDKNIEFAHSEMTKKVEMSVGDYFFKLISDSDSLHELGRAMYNCVYSYRMSVLNKKCVIVCAEIENMPAICIELRKTGGVVQALGRYNRRLESDERSVVEEWWSKIEKYITQNPDLK